MYLIQGECSSYTELKFKFSRNAKNLNKSLMYYFNKRQINMEILSNFWTNLENLNCSDHELFPINYFESNVFEKKFWTFSSEIDHQTYYRSPQTNFWISVFFDHRFISGNSGLKSLLKDHPQKHLISRTWNFLR